MPVSKRRFPPARIPVLSPLGAHRRRLTRKLFHDSFTMVAEIGRNPKYANRQSVFNPAHWDQDEGAMRFPAVEAWNKAQRAWLKAHP